MCGITGIWWRQPPEASQAHSQLKAMCDALSHRGPDDSGLWVEGAVGFGHRRLSIVDLSPLGHQPMESRDGRFVICFNGEIFNFGQLRDELAGRGHAFRGGSDTEVMLAAIQEWGLQAAVCRFVGMFAFALWDRQEQTLQLVRDRLGIKPLFVARSAQGDLLFGSELKALMAHSGFARQVNGEAVSAYLRYAYVPAPATIFRDAIKLLPGHILTLATLAGDWRQDAYWSLEEIAEHGQRTPFSGSFGDAADELEALARDAVRLRMIADVPLGAFLSGGVDSSLVVALMQAQSTRAIQTFTIGFEEARYDESEFARNIAAHLGTHHTEQRVTADEARAVIPALPGMYDEPLADSSQIPTYLVCALARRSVTVALSGDGGDELFGGYSRYAVAPQAWRWLRPIPRPVRQVAGRLLAGAAAMGIPTPGGPAKAMKISELLSVHGLPDVYRQLISTTSKPSRFLQAPRAPADPVYEIQRLNRLAHPEERMMLADTMYYLPDDLLCKLDRASMAVALEGRVPLLDHRVVEFAWRQPVQHRTGKALLKDVLGRYVPRALFERPKMGFEVPIGPWLRGPLRAWADDVLDPVALRAAGLFDVPAVRELLSQHVSGTRENAHMLWSVLMLESWRREWGAHV